jgi:hypothetical protein
MSRKRQPGGGRKPQGNIRGKVETFSTRITAETREALEREAAASGPSISQVAERLLMLGLGEKRRRGANRPLRALCYVIEQIALGAGSGRWENPHQSDPALRAIVAEQMDEWRTDPFRYRAFKIAVGMLLDALGPKGDIKSPLAAEKVDKYAAAGDQLFNNPAINELMKSTYASPENLAAFVFSSVWARLNRAHGLSENEMRIMRHGKHVGEMMLEEFYGMDDARVALNLGRKGEGQ